jgi:hypothetical protein
MYRRTNTGEPITVSRTGSDLTVQGGSRLTARTDRRFAAANGAVYDFTPDGLKVTDLFGSVDLYARLGSEELTPKPLGVYAGTYSSDEAETTLTAVVERDALILKRRPDSVIRLTPVYADAFRGSIGFVRFNRGNGGQIVSLSVTQDRVWEMRFQRVGSRLPTPD